MTFGWSKLFYLECRFHSKHFESEMNGQRDFRTGDFLSWKKSKKAKVLGIKAAIQGGKVTP